LPEAQQVSRQAKARPGKGVVSNYFAWRESLEFQREIKYVASWYNSKVDKRLLCSP
jgi:hypothetical protein